MTHIFNILGKMIILGLGSNLGDRQRNLRAAIELIGAHLLSNIRESSIISTPAMMPEDAPPSWNIEFMNMAISGELKVDITPLEFLAEIKKIETALGRTESERWAPRVIDIDILAWHDEIVDEPNLQIPHIGINGRDFVRLPLMELAPDWANPRTGLRLAGE